MPAHKHGIGGADNDLLINATYNFYDIVGGGGVGLVNWRTAYARIAGNYMNNTGGNGAHNNIQPTRTVLIVIKT